MKWMGLLTAAMLCGCGVPEVPSVVAPKPETLETLLKDFEEGLPITQLRAENEIVALGEQAVPAAQRALEESRKKGDKELEGRHQKLLDILISFRFFPMGVGYTWVYESAHGPDVIFVVTHRERIGGHDCFAVERIIGVERSTFYLTVSKKGVRLFRVGDQDFYPPYLEIAFPLSSREPWNWRGTIGESKFRMGCENFGSEVVETPLGPLTAVHIREDVNRVGKGSGRTDLWLAEGFGVVKLEGKSLDLHNPEKGTDSICWRLKFFTKQ